MSSDARQDLRPIVVVEDRYGGSYSGGRWWAAACADRLMDGLSRTDWLAVHGPGANDITCAAILGQPAVVDRSGRDT